VGLNMSGAVGSKEHEGDEQKDKGERACQAGGEDAPSVGAVDFCPGNQLGLVGRFDALQPVPPGAGAIKVRTDLRCTQGTHGDFRFTILDLRLRI